MSPGTASLHRNRHALSMTSVSVFLASWHACKHTYIHTCIHTYMHTYIHAYIHTCIHTYIHSVALHIRFWHVCVFIYACVLPVCMHICAYCLCARVGGFHVYLHASIRICICIYNSAKFCFAVCFHLKVYMIPACVVYV